MNCALYKWLFNNMIIIIIFIMFPLFIFFSFYPDTSLTKRELSPEEKKRILEENRKEYFWERHFKVDEKIPWEKSVI